jgi:uncharacterized protein HemX
MNEQVDDGAMAPPAKEAAPKSGLPAMLIRLLVIVLVLGLGGYFGGKEVMRMYMEGEERAKVEKPTEIDPNKPKPAGKASMQSPGG